MQTPTNNDLPPPPGPQEYAGHPITKIGSPIFQELLVDIKWVTDLKYTGLKLAALYFSRVNSMCMARPIWKRLTSFTMKDHLQVILEWEKELQNELKTLHALLIKLRSEMKASGSEVCLLRPTHAANIMERSWKLYKVDLDYPFVAKSVEECRVTIAPWKQVKQGQGN